MSWCQLTLALAGLAVISCERGAQAPSPNTKPTEEVTPKDNSAAQSQLGERALALIQEVGGALTTIKDEQSAAQASTTLDSIADQLRSLSAEMEQAGDPTPALADQLREQCAKADSSQQAEIAQSMQALQAEAETVTKINRALETLAEIRASKSFAAYGF